jgi:hypothetical protein
MRIPLTPDEMTTPLSDADFEVPASDEEGAEPTTAPDAPCRANARSYWSKHSLAAPFGPYSALILLSFLRCTSLDKPSLLTANPAENSLFARSSIFVMFRISTHARNSAYPSDTQIVSFL